MPLTFSTWLTNASDADFESLIRTRRDLLQPDSPTIASLSAAASSRIGVSRGIEALNADELEFFIAMARSARVSPDIAVSEITMAGPSPAESGNANEAQVAPVNLCEIAEVVLPRLRDLALAWPSTDSARAEADATKPGTTTEAYPTWRIQSEAITLLPTSAADSHRVQPWRAYQTEDAHSGPNEVIPLPLIHNSEQAAVAEVVSSLRGIVDELSVSPASRLTSGGISKRDVSRLARAVDLGLEQTISLLLAARALALIGVLDDPLDPQWTGNPGAAATLEMDRAELWSTLVSTWLRESLEVTQLTAGASANERLTVLANPKKSLFKGMGLSVPALPLLKYTVLQILHEIGLGSSRSARWIHARVLRTHPLIPAHDFAITEVLLHTAVMFGLATTPLKQPESFGPSGFGAMLTPALERAMDQLLHDDPGIAPLGFSVEGLAVPEELTQTVRNGLVPEVDAVLIQSDLTAVATGPIEPRIHHILRKYAVVEARGQGTVYRIDAPTLEDSMQTGINAEDALRELADISVEPLPSTLEFLVHNTAAKLHRVQVAGARAVLVVDDPVDLDVIMADPLMFPANLERLAPTVAISHIGPERTMNLLESGEHHALMHSPTVERHRAVITESEPEVRVRKRARVTDDNLGDYIRLLRSPQARSATATSTDEPLGHMDRLREAAADRRMVRMRLADSHGQERTIDMVPSTVNGGRVRGIVRTTGAEASLSIARILSVEEAK